MIFKQIAEIENEEKTKTRRGTKAGETYIKVFRQTTAGLGEQSIEIMSSADSPAKGIIAVYTPSGRKKWRVGDIQPMIPKMYQKGVGYVRIKGIALERLGDITESDALAEGIVPDPTFDGFYCYSLNGVLWGSYKTAVDAYKALWEFVNGKGSWEKQQDDLVWVLTFEYVGQVHPSKREKEISQIFGGIEVEIKPLGDVVKEFISMFDVLKEKK